MFLCLARRHIEPKGKAEERLEKANKASVRARDLTQQLLTFSRGGTPVKKAVSIAGLIKESVGFALRGSNIRCDFGLPDDWMNSTVGLQWKTGLPPGFTERIHWQKFDALWFGVADRNDLIFLKLYAAADSEGPSSVHFQDLLALRPTEIELKEAAEWVRSQDTSPQFAEILEQVLDHATRNL